MVKTKRLGKGLEAIFQKENIVANNSEEKIINIKLSSIKKNPYQPRTIFNQEKIKELAESIENNGLLQPIIVRQTLNGYYIIAGERRYRAFDYLKKEEIPAIVKELNDEEMMIFSILENLQREDLSPLEEAASYKKLIEKTNYKQEELAEKIGKSRPYIANSLRLLNLPIEVKTYLVDGKISAAHARTLLALKNKELIIKVCEKIILENMSVRALEKYIVKINEKKQPKVIKKDLFISDQEEKLKKILGTTVIIKQNKNQKGKIEIEFKNNDEFERIIKLFKG